MKLYRFLVIKMLLLPVLYWLILGCTPIPEEIARILVLMMAMPIPSNTVVYASLYQKNVRLASEASVLTSLICVVTIPLVFAVISIL